MTGKVTFVGAGTGDPRLLTLRAADVIAEADVVFFDPDIHPDVLGRVREGTPCHPVAPDTTAELVAEMLVNDAERGRHVVRLTWADPLFFGPADTEAAAVFQRGLPLEVVPGVGPIGAAGAYAGCALTRTSDPSASVAVVEVTHGNETLHAWDKLATTTDALVILCDRASVGEAARSLVFYGRRPTERVTMIENVSLPSQRTTELTLGELPLLAGVSARRVVLLVGECTTQKLELSWFESRPLFGKRILVTRAREQASKMATLLRDRGADPVVVPTIEIHPPDDRAPMIDAVSAMGSRYGWVVFTSENGVEHLWSEISRQGKDARVFGQAKIAAIGPGTALALARVGLVADLVPSVHKGEELAAELVAAIDFHRSTSGEPPPRVLVARAEVARDVVPTALRSAGCTVDVVSVYKTLAPRRPLLDALASLLEGGDIDAVTFTSSSTVTHLCDALEPRAVELLANACVASIGPVTSETARRRGIRVDVTASDHTVPGLVAALESHFDVGRPNPSGTRSVVGKLQSL